MAYNKEAMDYLHELERNPDWNKLPENDSRILKLRELFKADDQPLKRKKGKRMQVTISGVPIVFESLTACAQALSINRNDIYVSIASGVAYKGMTFARLD